MTQPNAVRDSGADSRSPPTAWQSAAPWAILGVWVTADLAVVVYWASREWGFLEAVPLLIELAFHLLGLAAWLTGFAVLANCDSRLRAAYYAVGTMAVAGLLVWILGFGGFRTLLAFATFQVGLALPFWAIRKLGWRIAMSPSDVGVTQPLARWQFTVGDLLVMTTLIALFLGLLMASGGLHSLDDVYVMAALFCGAPAVIVVALAWRRFWRAAAVSVLGSTLLGLLPIAWDSSSPAFEVVLRMLIVSGPLLSLLAASACLRWAGYRLC